MRARAVVALLFLLAGGSAVAQEGVSLIPRFAAGERVRYRMQLTAETESLLSPPGAPPATRSTAHLSFDITWSLEALSVAPDGTAELRAVIEALQMESVPPAPQPVATETFINKPIAYRWLPDGRVENIQAPPEWLENGQPPAWLRQWLEQGGGTSSAAPTHPVKPGEKWTDTRDVEVPGLPRQHVTAESVYTRDTQVGETPCASVLTRFELAGAESREEKGPDDTKLAVESRVEGGGSRLSCYDLRNGRVLESTQTSHEEFRLELKRLGGKSPDAALPVVMKTRTTTEAFLRVVN